MTKFLITMTIFASFTAMAQSALPKVSPGFNGFDGELSASQNHSSNGSCGSLGCGSENESLGTLIAVLKDSDVKAFMGPQKVYSVVRKSSMIEQYEITFDSKNKICARVEYIEMPMTIDGKASVVVGNRNVIISADKGKCQ